MSHPSAWQLGCARWLELPQPPAAPEPSGSLGSAVAQSFSEAYGSAPSGVWSAPGRVNLMGEHTDYNAGLCLPIALPHRTYAAVRLRSDRRLRLRSLQSSQQYDLELDDVRPGNPSGWGAYAAGVLWALETAGHQVQGLDLMVDGQVPVGAGLSSSAALECAVAAAVSDLMELALLVDDQARSALAAICVNAENTIARAPTGGMDQSASLRCQEANALLLDCRDGSVQHVPFDPSDQGLSLLVMVTHAEHSLVDGQYEQRRQDCEEAARRLGARSLREVPVSGLYETLDRLSDKRIRARAKHIVTEIERVRQTVALLRAGRLSDVGSVFNASHVSMRDDFEISCAELDVAVDTATAHGALGARMTGGGFGGSAIALVPTGLASKVTSAVLQGFADKGFGAPDCFAVIAGGPAQRES
ncbi:MAG: galactokinase [Dermatophilaceae bacterium]